MSWIQEVQSFISIYTSLGPAANPLRCMRIVIWSGTFSALAVHLNDFFPGQGTSIKCWDVSLFRAMQILMSVSSPHSPHSENPKAFRWSNLTRTARWKPQKPLIFLRFSSPGVEFRLNRFIPHRFSKRHTWRQDHAIWFMNTEMFTLYIHEDRQQVFNHARTRRPNGRLHLHT